MIAVQMIAVQGMCMLAMKQASQAPFRQLQSC